MSSSIPIDVKNMQGATRLGRVGYEVPVNFRLNQGEIGVLLGGGKPRRVIQILMDLGSLQGGEISFYGHNIDDVDRLDSLDWRRQIGFAFREKGLLSNLSLLKNIDLPARYHGFYGSHKREASLAHEALEELKVSKDYWHRLPSEVPEEIYKKALLARASVLKPKLLIIDDPTSMIPWPQLPFVISWLKQLARSGTAILLCTPDYPVGIALADWVLVPDFSDVDYNFRDNMDPSWVEVSDILNRAIGKYETVV